MDLQTLNWNIRLHERLDRAYEMLQSLRDRAYPGAQNLDGMPRGTDVSDKVGNLAIAIADLESRIEALKTMIAENDDQIRTFANTIDDERIQMAVQLRYINGLSWTETADALGYGVSEDTIRKLCYRQIPAVSGDDQPCPADSGCGQ